MSKRSVGAPSCCGKRPKIVLGLFALLLIIAVIWWFAGKDTDASKASQPGMGGMRGGFMMEAVPVSVHRLQAGQFARSVKALGTVTPWNSADVTSQVSGYLREVLFEEGQEVAEGQVLARLDERSYQAALLQAEGALQETRAQLAQAELDLRRYQDLLKDESIAQQTMEQQQTQVNQLRGTLKVREAQRDAAKLNVEYSQITAPIAGRLGLRAVDVGNHIAAGNTVLATITQQQPIAVSFTLAEQHVPELVQALQQERPLLVEAWSRDDRMLLASGELASMDNRVDTNTGTVRLKARFTNADKQLFPQQFVNVRLQLAIHEEALKIPNDALQFGNQGRFVWVIDEENQAQMQQVQLGVGDAEFTLVDEGLKPEQLVVVEGVDRLKNGSKVEIITLNGEPIAPVEANSPAQGDSRAGRNQQK